MYNENIKKVIRERGWTTEKLAAEMIGRDGTKGVTQSGVSQIINGNPTLGKLHEIAEIIGVSVTDLISGNTGGESNMKCPHCGRSIRVCLEAGD